MARSLAFSLSTVVLLVSGAVLPSKAHAFQNGFHLVPIDPMPPDWGREYRDACHRLLQYPPDRHVAVMLYKPAFGPEECLLVQKSKTGKRDYTVSYLRASGSIWNSLPRNNGEGKAVEITVDRTVSPFPTGVGDRVCRLWDQALLDVRYPIPDGRFGGVMDGVTVEFWREFRYGESDNPEFGCPVHLTNLGRSLIDYCRAPIANKGGELKKIEEKCRLFEDYLKSRPEREVGRPPNLQVKP